MAVQLPDLVDLAFRAFPTRKVHFHYISGLRYTILVGNPQFVLVLVWLQLTVTVHGLQLQFVWQYIALSYQISPWDTISSLSGSQAIKKTNQMKGLHVSSNNKIVAPLPLPLLIQPPPPPPPPPPPLPTSPLPPLNLQNSSFPLALHTQLFIPPTSGRCEGAMRKDPSGTVHHHRVGGRHIHLVVFNRLTCGHQCVQRLTSHQQHLFHWWNVCLLRNQLLQARQSAQCKLFVRILRNTPVHPYCRPISVLIQSNMDR